MQFLKHASSLMAVAGLVLAGAAWIFDVDQLFVLIGLLLAWAGVVKIVVVLIWTRIAMIGSEDHRPISGQ